MPSNDKEYFEYLHARSVMSLIYRKYWLYPILNTHLHGSALDIGCGIGDMLSVRRNTVGVDINPYAVDYCNENGLIAHLMKRDVLPFDDNVFDSVILDNVLEHLANPVHLLIEIKRVIKDSGVFLVGVPGRAGYDSDSDHKVFYDKDSLSSLMTSIGFKAVRFIQTPLPIPILGKVLNCYCIYGLFKVSTGAHDRGIQSP